MSELASNNDEDIPESWSVLNTLFVYRQDASASGTMLEITQYTLQDTKSTLEAS